MLSVRTSGHNRHIVVAIFHFKFDSAKVHLAILLMARKVAIHE